jgi:hypothetical protein
MFIFQLPAMSGVRSNEPFEEVVTMSPEGGSASVESAGCAALHRKAAHPAQRGMSGAEGGEAWQFLAFKVFEARASACRDVPELRVAEAEGADRRRGVAAAHDGQRTR